MVLERPVNFEAEPSVVLGEEDVGVPNYIHLSTDRHGVASVEQQVMKLTVLIDSGEDIFDEQPTGLPQVLDDGREIPRFDQFMSRVGPSLFLDKQGVLL